MRAGFLAALLLTVLTLAGWQPVSRAEIAGAKIKPDRVWFGLLIQSPIKSGEAYTHRLYVDVPQELAGTPAPSLWLQVRGLPNHKLVATVPFTAFHDGQIRQFSTSGLCLDFSYISRIRSLPAGDYVAAVVGEEGRFSNVCGFQINPDLNESTLQVLDPVLLDMPGYRELPLVGLRVHLPQEPSLELFAPNLTFVPVWIDGIKRDVTMTAWAGSAGPSAPGARYLVVVDPEAHRLPKMDAREEHTLELNVGGYSAGPIIIRGPSELGVAWDAATKLPEVKR